MKECTLYDEDNVESVFSGEDHRILIETCCRYSAYLALSFWIDKEPLRALEVLAPFEISIPKTIPKDFLPGLSYEGITEKPLTYYKFYRVCPELPEVLTSITDSLFSWISAWGYNNPEDLYFYRADGSLFLQAIVHEGECMLSPEEGEDVALLLKKGNWFSWDDDPPSDEEPPMWENFDTRLATPDDALAMKAFYASCSEASSLRLRALDPWEQELLQAQQDETLWYMLDTIDDQIRFAFRMRFLGGETSSEARVAIIDQVAESKKYPQSPIFAYKKAEELAKKHGCQTGILADKNSRQLWPVYGFGPFSSVQDITGDAFRSLLEHCGRYCTVMSLRFPLDGEISEKYTVLNDYEIPIPRSVVATDCHPQGVVQTRNENDEPLDYLRFFRVCPEVLESMLSLDDHAFGWMNPRLRVRSACRPSAPAFYRGDGSVFFSIPQYGCILTPRQNEDVSDIISSQGWLLFAF